MKQQTQLPYFAALGLAMSAVSSGYGQTLSTGPSTTTTPYLQTVAAPGNSNGIWVDSITSFLTAKDRVQNTGAAAGTTYEMGGVPDGLGAFDNGDGTITLLVNHEILNNNISLGSGINGDITTGTHAHGGTGAYVSQWVVNKSTLQVVSGKDLINTVVDTSGVSHFAGGTGANAPLTFARFCSADLAGSNAFYNPVSGFGTQDRIFMNGEESTGGGFNGTGRVLANVVTGGSAGTSYQLATFGASGTQGSWENFLAHPNKNNVLGDTTVVMSNSDNGTGITNNTVGIYVGTKQNTGTVADKAGLTNGTFKFISVAGANDTSGTTIDELASTTTRASAITTGTRFSLSATSPTTFSRPEDGAWDPTNPNRYYFVTTDRIDGSTAAGGGQTNPTTGSSGAGTQIGMSRLWALNFDDITNPNSGGTISLLIDGGKPNQKVQMFDNMTVDASGRIFMNEDPGNSTYNGKIWTYDPTTDALTMLTKFDTARWGDLASAGGTPGFTGAFNNDKETSGILDVTSLFTSTPGVGEKFLLTTVQDHASGATADTFTTEGGQLLLLHTAPEPGRAMLLGLGLGAAILRRRRK